MVGVVVAASPSESEVVGLQGEAATSIEAFLPVEVVS